MRLSKQEQAKLQVIFCGSSTMWKLMFNGINGLIEQSKNYQVELFKQLDAYGFRLLNDKGEPCLYGMATATTTEPLKQLQENYHVKTIEYSFQGGWLPITGLFNAINERVNHG